MYIINSNNIHIGQIIHTTSPSRLFGQEISSTPQQIPPERRHVGELLQSKRIIGHWDIVDVCDHLGSLWKQLGLQNMDFTLAELEQIEENNRQQLFDRSYELINQWKDKMSSDATVDNLTKCLMDVNAFDSVKKMKP